MWREFVELAEKRQEPFISLCARFGISRKTGYKWLKRFRQRGADGLAVQSRRPKTSPRRTPETVVDAILALRRENPDWSAARIQTALQETEALPVPAPSTIDLILRRQRDAAAAQVNLLGADALRYEPNFRWMLHVGAETRLSDGAAVGAVLVRDDTTGFIVGADVITVKREEMLQSHLEQLFRRHGMPWRITLPCDEDMEAAAPSRMHSPLSVWLMRLAIIVEFHSRAAAEADLERRSRQMLAAKLSKLPAYQRTAIADRVAANPLKQFVAAAPGMDAERARMFLERVREEENFQGNHEAMQRRSPISLYRPSSRPFPREIATPIYAPEAEIRLVSEKGIFTFRRRLIHVGRAFAGFCVELKETPYGERFIVLFAGQLLGVADLSQDSAGLATSLQLTRG